MHSRERPTPAGALRYVSSPFDVLAGRDVHDLLALRAEIFVVEQSCVYLDPDGHDLEAWHLLGRDAHGVLGAYARVQPGATVCGLSRIGVAATIGAGATLVERLRVGDGAYVAAGAVVIEDVAPGTLVAGVPARFVKALSLR